MIRKRKNQVKKDKFKYGYHVWNIKPWNDKNPDHQVKESDFSKDLRNFSILDITDEIRKNTLSHLNALEFLKILPGSIADSFKEYINYIDPENRENLVHYTYVWKLENQIRYCGLSYNPWQRWLQVKSKAMKFINSNKNRKNNNQKVLFSSIKKYGFDSFSREVVDIHLSLSAAKAAEIELIEINKTNRKKYPDGIGMNLTPGGDEWDGVYRNSNFAPGAIQPNKFTMEKVRQILLDKNFKLKDENCYKKINSKEWVICLECNKEMIKNLRIIYHSPQCGCDIHNRHKSRFDKIDILYLVPELIAVLMTGKVLKDLPEIIKSKTGYELSSMTGRNFISKKLQPFLTEENKLKMKQTILERRMEGYQIYNKNYNKIRNEKILSLRKSGLSIQKISKDVKTTWSVVKNVLIENNYL